MPLLAPTISAVITDSERRRILCFGDSNTHGTPSDDPAYVRLPPDRRWTGLLQRLLGNGYDIIEEGLEWRTTDMDYEDRAGYNGRSYFVPCLLSHAPLDVVVIMLGSNDLQHFKRTPTAIADALDGLVDDVAATASERGGRVPTTVLVSPIWIDDTPSRMASENFDPEVSTRSRDLTTAIRLLAERRGVVYADAARVAHAGGDGVHLSLDSHAPLAEYIASAVGPG